MMRIVLISFFLFLTNTSFAQYGEPYEAIKKKFGNDVNTGINSKGDRYLYYDGEDFRYYYVFNNDNICVKLVQFPVSYIVQREFENELDLLSKIKPRNYERISSNKWRRKDHRGYVQILSGRYLAKSAFIITAIDDEEESNEK